MNAGRSVSVLSSPSGVYALVDPRTGVTMYVGQSCDVVRRFKQHLDVNHYEPNLDKRRWLAGLRRAGLSPTLVILEEHDLPHELDAAEKRLIREFKVKGEAELNVAAGGAGSVVVPVLNSKRHEWVELGRKVKECRALLFEIAADAERLAGKKYGRSVGDVVKRFDGMKCVLDGVLVRTFPEWKEFTKVFYGPESSDRG